MQQDTRYIRGIVMRVASGLFSWSMAAGLLAFSSRQFALTINHEPLSASHYFLFLSKRSGRRMPPAERSALYYILHLVFYIVQYHYCICLVEAGLLPARFMANRHRSTRRSRATAPVDLKPLKYLIL